MQNSNQKQFIVLTFYKFIALAELNSLRDSLREFCTKQKLKGTILLATEGINGTVAGDRSAIDQFKNFMDGNECFKNLPYKESIVSELPFYRMKVKIKKEIVSMGVKGLNPGGSTGIRLDADSWNELLSDPDILLIDTRNEYECDIGNFKGAISPRTSTFREFPTFVNKHLDPARHKKIAMYCTGGIRCEKASAFLIQQGFENVYQLNGGILKYLQDIEPEESLWQGECFVFDGRVSVDVELNEGKFEQCFACRRPLSVNDRKSEYFEQGISCPYCYNDISEAKRTGLKERQKQVELANKRNTQHIGIPLDSK